MLVKEIGPPGEKPGWPLLGERDERKPVERIVTKYRRQSSFRPR